MSKPPPARYRTTNWSSYNASVRKRGSLLIWVDDDMTWRAPGDGRPGRPAVSSDAAMQFCLSIKILFKLPRRQTAGMVASLLRLAGLDWPMPDSYTPCRRQKTLAVQVPYRRADGPLKLLVDSTGIKFLGGDEWQARKHGVQGRRRWRKVQLAMDPAPSDIRAVEFTPQPQRKRSYVTERCCKSLETKDSHRQSMALDTLHEQAITRPLSYDELVQLQRIGSQAGGLY